MEKLDQPSFTEINFEHIFDVSPDLIFILDEEQNIIRANRAMALRLGVSAESIVGQKCFLCIHQKTKSPDFCAHAQLLKDGQEHTTELFIEHMRGWFSITVTPLLNKEGKITGAIHIARDITERKKTEEKLLFISKALESARDAVGISDAEGHHIYQNKALSDLFEYTTAEELEAAGGGPIVVKDPVVAKEMFEKIMNGQSWAGELEMVTKTGHVFPAYERADAIKDNYGKIVGLIGIITDITERKRVEKSLAESETRYRRLFETAKDGTLILDAENGMIVDVNPFLVEMLGYSKEQFLEKAIWEIGFFKDIVANKDKFLELQQQEYVRYNNLPLETLDGQKKNVEFVSNVYQVNSHKVIQPYSGGRNNKKIPVALKVKSREPERHNTFFH
jgi:PAS domain S-box-containing protein